MTGDGTKGAEQAEVIASFLAAHRFRYRNEGQLHDAIAGALEAGAISAEPEVQLTPHERIDFMAGRIGIEVKVAGTPAAVTRQLRRYADSPDVDALVLVTNRARHLRVAREIGGKPVRVVCLSGLAA